MKKGLFIAFEGLDGCGKTTQVKKIYSELINYLNIKTFSIAFPSETDFGKFVREKINSGDLIDNPWASTFAFLTDISYNIEKHIKPRLANGEIVLCDRFIDSTIAYQGASGVPLYQIEHASEYFLKGLEPDITFFIDLKPEECRKRLRGRQGMELDSIENQSLEFHQKVYDNYMTRIKRSSNYIVIDGKKSIFDITTDIVEIILKKMFYNRQQEVINQFHASDNIKKDECLTMLRKDFEKKTSDINELINSSSVEELKKFGKFLSDYIADEQTLYMLHYAAHIKNKEEKETDNLPSEESHGEYIMTLENNEYIDLDSLYSSLGRYTYE